MTDKRADQREDPVQHLLQGLGIARSYIDYGGRDVSIDGNNRRVIAELMGARFDDEDALQESIRQLLGENGHRLLPATLIGEAGSDTELQLNIPADQQSLSLEWSLLDGEEILLSGSLTPGDLPLQGDEGEPQSRLWRLPAQAPGYYDLELRLGERQEEALLISAPAACHEPGWLRKGRKLAGLSAQVYALRSPRNWGMGDFSDLRTLIREAGAQGIDFIVLNPLHALDSLHPSHCSPYSPLDRRFLNPLYLDLEAEADFQESETARAYVTKAKTQKSLDKLRAAELVDYPAVAKHKQHVLSLMFESFRKRHLDKDSERARAFLQWRAADEETLLTFGRYEADRQTERSGPAAEADYHIYLQWLATRQLKSCQSAARDAGMALGLVRDLAVGGNESSAEVRLNEGLFCAGASIGAPPDSFAPQGQNWGLPPMNPVALVQSRFRHFVQLLRNNMQHCGALRIDHVMALMRLWWCPGKDHSGKGAYVHYPVEALFAILRLESQRQRCMVIGEDLGVVPPEIRQYMADSRVFGSAVFYFEKYDPVTFRKPEHYPRDALAMIANHDVPTLKAWWSKSDLELRQELGLYDDEQQLSEAIHERESDLIQVLHWLDGQGLLPDSWKDFNIHNPFDRDLCKAILENNSRSASRMVSLQPEDLCLAQLPVNIPGTSEEYPNWRRKLPVDTEALFQDAGRKEMLAAFVAARHS